MRQGGARQSGFFLPVKTCLSAHAVHLFMTRRSTSTVLYWSSSQAASNHPPPGAVFPTGGIGGRLGRHSEGGAKTNKKRFRKEKIENGRKQKTKKTLFAGDEGVNVHR